MTNPEQARLFDTSEFYDPAADPWRPENMTPYLAPEVVSDDSLHEWGSPSAWGETSSFGVDGFGGWAA